MTENSKTQTVGWHDRHILTKAGRKPEPILRLLQKYNLPTPAVMTIYQWIARGRIAGRWRAAVIYVLMAEQIITVADLFARVPVAPPGADPEDREDRDDKRDAAA